MSQFLSGLAQTSYLIKHEKQHDHHADHHHDSLHDVGPDHGSESPVGRVDNHRAGKEQEAEQVVGVGLLR